MAKLDDLIAQVPDAKLRNQLTQAAGELRRRKKFGLVFEQHIPETTVLPDATVRKGSVVLIRTEPANRTRYVVEGVDGTQATITSGEEAWTLPIRDLLVVKPFGEPVYPVLRQSVQPVVRDPDKPFHTVINGENFHALQLLMFGYEGQADCIYIDPPYNTGARDWKYNNDYVDDRDSWRHSKWLSMMDKRLRLAKRLLRPDGVLIVAIDEHELYHLGMLLESIFPEYLRYKITVVVNASGNTGTRNFGVVDEQLLFCVPDLGRDVIVGIPAEEGDDDNGNAGWYWDHARRRGGGSSYRHQRRNQFYPIYIDEKEQQVVRTGRSIPLDEKPSFKSVKGLRPIWPIDSRGNERVWCYTSESMQRAIEHGNVELGRYNKTQDSWTIRVRRPKVALKKVKSVWRDPAYHAGVHGTDLVNRLLGRPGLFPFPKSLYAVRDSLAAVVRDRPNALIIDFFAGSGTTLHATLLLNAEDNGRRRCILVTNNEVDERTSKALHKEGYFVGDSEYDRNGICNLVTIPRVEAALTGLQAENGEPVAGKYVGDRPIADGFEENAAYFDMKYADPDAIDIGASFEDILPALWFASGCQGDPSALKQDDRWLLSSKSRFAVLLDEDRFRAFRTILVDHPEISHVWLVTDSEAAFARMRERIGGSRKCGMLYRDYLRNFQVNVDPSLATGDLP